MLERVSASGIVPLLIGCWLSACPAEGRQAPASGIPRSAEADSLRDSISFRPDRSPYPGAPLLLSAPVVDMPYGLQGGLESPGMRQSMMWNAAFTQWANQSIGWLWEGLPQGYLRAFGTYGSLGLFSWLSVYFPPGGGWMHEEWHRAVMSRYGIPSFDGVYHWNIGSDMIAVDHVADRDLADLKAGHPADFTRLMEAGIESETESIRLMRRNNFFLGRASTYDALGWWVTSLNGTAYIYMCSTRDIDSELGKANRNEPQVSRRDFTGLDFRAWVYDMRHPGEPYADGPRGRPHPPDGVGFDRYLLYTDLSSGERDYLRLQACLSLLNLVSPQLVGYDWLPGTSPWDGRGLLWNFGLVHHLTPFGYQVGGDVLVRRGRWSWVFSASGMVNGEMILPGFEAQLFRYPFAIRRRNLYVTFDASAWMQPDDQLYRTTSLLPGGSALINAAFPLQSYLEVFLEADAKTPGWVAGNVYLDAAVQGRAGLQLRL